MIRTLLLLISLLAITPDVRAGSHEPVIRKDRALVLDGVIQQGNIMPLATKMLLMADQGKLLVDLIINSPGGSVTTGFLFINAMEEAKARGLHIRCFVPEVAASMAFGILIHCDERHALSKSFLLWHRARVSLGGFGAPPMTAPQLLVLGRDLASLDRVIFEECLDALGMTEKLVRYHFEAETLHVGSILGQLAPSFIRIHDRVQGLYEAMMDNLVPHTLKSQNPFGEFQAGELVYMTDKDLSVAHLQSRSDNTK